MASNQESSSKSNRLLRWSGIGILLVSFGSKLKALLPLLKLGKFGGTFISMLVSVGAYALLFRWQFAVGLVLMIFIHELGHVWAAKRKGLPTSAPAFIPFVGALIMMKRQPQDAKTEAYIAIGGPIMGTVGALLCYGLAMWTGYGVLFAIAYIGFLINLFNLIPIHPLDGGRIAVAITRWLWVVGLILGLVAIIYLRSLLLIIIYGMFVYELWLTYRGNRKPQKVTYSFPIHASRFEEAGAPFPGEEHQRELPFEQYCDIQSQQHYLTIFYPGVGEITRVEGVRDGVHQVYLRKTQPSMESGQAEMTVDLKVTPQTVLEKNQQYYQVDSKSRWGYGLAYVGLAVLLVMMMMMTQTVMPDPNML